MISVVKTAAEKSNWGKNPNVKQGFSVYFSHRSYVAQVADIEIQSGSPILKKITAVTDCGMVVNPDGVAQQMEGSVVMGLTAALYGQISIEQGRVKESNFHDYEMLRLSESPEIEVVLLESDGASVGGLGEPATPPISAAVSNALYALTGQRVRELPLKNYQFLPPPVERGAVDA
jgi:isoquinoline 1-oxidoreductase beta subunit